MYLKTMSFFSIFMIFASNQFNFVCFLRFNATKKSYLDSIRSIHLDRKWLLFLIEGQCVNYYFFLSLFIAKVKKVSREKKATIFHGKILYLFFSIKKMSHRSQWMREHIFSGCFETNKLKKNQPTIDLRSCHSTLKDFAFNPYVHLNWSMEQHFIFADQSLIHATRKFFFA